MNAGRRPNYRVLGAAMTFAILASVALAIFVDIMAAVIAFAFFALVGGLLTILTGDLNLPEDYELPNDDLSDTGRSLWNWPHK